MKGLQRLAEVPTCSRGSSGGHQGQVRVGRPSLLQPAVSPGCRDHGPSKAHGTWLLTPWFLRYLHRAPSGKSQFRCTEGGDWMFSTSTSSADRPESGYCFHPRDRKGLPDAGGGVGGSFTGAHPRQTQVSLLPPAWCYKSQLSLRLIKCHP